VCSCAGGVCLSVLVRQCVCMESRICSEALILGR
jgi:hypothetical protein